jgi:sRNA-binding carbon storage regulator CsrA
METRPHASGDDAMMIIVSRQIDQELLIGRDIYVGPTDIDARGARILAHGRMLGGPDDGAPFTSTHELSVGQSFFIGPRVNVALIGVNTAEMTATLGILRPMNMPVFRKEIHEQMKRQNPDEPQ